MVHDFAALVARVKALEDALDLPRKLRDAYTPTPKDACAQSPDTATGTHTVGTAGRYTVGTAGRYLVTTGTLTFSGTGAPNFVRPPQGVCEKPPAYAATSGMVKVTWEDELSGVSVTSPPCPTLYEARRSARRLFEAAAAEHLKTFKPSYWFTIDDFRRLRAAVSATPDECFKALHSTGDYEHALAYLLQRDAKLKK